MIYIYRPQHQKLDNMDDLITNTSTNVLANLAYYFKHAPLKHSFHIPPPLIRKRNGFIVL